MATLDRRIIRALSSPVMVLRLGLDKANNLDGLKRELEQRINHFRHGGESDMFTFGEDPSGRRSTPRFNTLESMVEDLDTDTATLTPWAQEQLRQRQLKRL